MANQPTSMQTAAEKAAAAKYADKEIADQAHRRAHGDGVDWLGLRDGMNKWGLLALFAVGAVFLWVGFQFDWQAGAVVFPSMRDGAGKPNGGWATVANNVAFILAVYFWRRDPGGARNPFVFLVLSTACLAFFSIYTSQTTAADKVRVAVAAHDALEKTIADLDRKIAATEIPSAERAQLALDAALDEAVGSHLTRLGDELEHKLCARYADEEPARLTCQSAIAEEFAADKCRSEPVFDNRMACRRQILRASVDCTQDMKTKVRDNTCDPITSAKSKLKQIADMTAQLKLDRDTRLVDQAKLDAMPPASNVFIQVLSKWPLVGGDLQDTQAKVYVLLGLIFLLTPAFIFAYTLERRKLP